MKKAAGLLLLLCAYLALFPGLTQQMLSVSGEVEKVKLVEVGKDLIQNSPNTPALVNNLVDMVVDGLDVSGTVNAFDKTNSILGTAKELLDNGHLPVAVLIVLFSVVVPLLKAALLIAATVTTHYRGTLLVVSNIISKWSMADVFVIAIFIAYLAGMDYKNHEALSSFKPVWEPASGTSLLTAYCLYWELNYSLAH